MTVLAMLNHNQAISTGLTRMSGPKWPQQGFGPCLLHAGPAKTEKVNQTRDNKSQSIPILS
jgi:hypothetical protein